ncbi:alpha/beta hydrolase [Acetobacter sacchari]|uniref:Alpha/beta hydrolase n=1 Tax=Acetobacter sacchari TaxID=2661687 RepID=A0ABS3M107_9PROT|nr:alpha/beta fold hydrolase [Acetobacter sacchari]MBO1361871.1 alpha/beta hydrolase [Acetobacter sacchari]
MPIIGCQQRTEPLHSLRTTERHDAFQLSHWFRCIEPFDILIVPGLRGSSEAHWQSRWDRLLRSYGISVMRVRQPNWTHPDYNVWKENFIKAYDRCRRPVLIVAHSLGATLTVRVATECNLTNIGGALLVAVADVEQHEGRDADLVRTFAPLPSSVMNFPSFLLFSRNDPWLKVRRARQLARAWNASLFDCGRLGHIGEDTQLGEWAEGLSALTTLATYAA